MLLNMAKVLFVVRKTKSNTGKHFLYCRITAQRITREFSTEQEITHPEKWNQQNQFYEVESREGDFINLLCDKLKYDIKIICVSNPEFTPDHVIQRFKQPVKANISLQTIVSEYIQHERKEGRWKDATMRHREDYLNNLLLFAKQQVYANDVDERWAERFIYFLKTKKENPCLHDTRASRHIEYYRKALNWAVGEKKITDHCLHNYSAKRDKRKPLIYLTEPEKQVWYNGDFTDIGFLQKAQKCFTVQMNIGVSYMDLWAEYEVQNVKDDNNNTIGKILLGKRGKNGQVFFVPYNEIAEEILKEYNYKLPYLDNSDYNKAIKIIAKILGIQKRITTHTARRTFIMSRKNEGWDMYTVKEMAGHKSSRTTEVYYTEATPDRLINEIKNRKLLNR